MGLPIMKELRRHERYETKRLPGFIINPVTNETIPCNAVDVSKEGVGVVSTLWIPPQMDVLLVIGSQRIELEIKWGIENRPMPAWAKKNASIAEDSYLYRYGLMLANPDEKLDLTEVFRREGCME